MRASFLVLAFCSCVALLAADPGKGADTPNGAEAYREAIELQKGILPDDLNVVSDWDTVALDDRIARILADGEEIADAVHRGAAANGCDWGIDYSPGILTKLPHLAPCRIAAQLMCLRARYRLSKGDPAGAAQDLADALQLATDTGNQGVLVSELVRQSTQAMVAKFAAANAGRFSQQEARMILAKLDAYKPMEGLKAAIRTDKELTLASIPRITDKEWQSLNLQAKLSDVQRSESLRAIGEAFDGYIAALDSPPDVAIRTLEKIHDGLNASDAARAFIPSPGAFRATFDRIGALKTARESLASRR